MCHFDRRFKQRIWNKGLLFVLLFLVVGVGCVGRTQNVLAENYGIEYSGGDELTMGGPSLTVTGLSTTSFVEFFNPRINGSCDPTIIKDEPLKVECKTSEEKTLWRFENVDENNRDDWVGAWVDDRGQCYYRPYYKSILDGSNMKKEIKAKATISKKSEITDETLNEEISFLGVAQHNFKKAKNDGDFIALFFVPTSGNLEAMGNNAYRSQEGCEKKDGNDKVPHMREYGYYLNDSSSDTRIKQGGLFLTASDLGVGGKIFVETEISLRDESGDPVQSRELYYGITDFDRGESYKINGSNGSLSGGLYATEAAVLQPSSLPSKFQGLRNMVVRGGTGGDYIYSDYCVKSSGVILCYPFDITDTSDKIFTKIDHPDINVIFGFSVHSQSGMMFYQRKHKDYLRVYGGNVYSDGEISAFSKEDAFGSGSSFGSYGQYGVISFGSNDEFGSGNIQLGKTLSFTMSSSGLGVGVKSNKEKIKDYMTPGLEDCVSSPFSITGAECKVNSKKGVYEYKGTGTKEVEVNGVSDLASGTTIIIRTSGDVKINNNLTYGNIDSLSRLPRIIIIANNIMISAKVNRVDALLVADQEVKSCEEGNADCSTLLTVNGTIVAGKFNANRSVELDSANPKEELPTSPAEEINFDPSLYDLRLGGDNETMKVVNITELPPRY